MSVARSVALEVVASNAAKPIHWRRLQEITVGRYARTGANGALFGFTYPWMVKVGEMRYLTEHGRRRLGV